MLIYANAQCVRRQWLLQEFCLSCWWFSFIYLLILTLPLHNNHNIFVFENVKFAANLLIFDWFRCVLLLISSRNGQAHEDISTRLWPSYWSREGKKHVKNRSIFFSHCRSLRFFFFSLNMFIRCVHRACVWVCLSVCACILFQFAKLLGH